MLLKEKKITPFLAFIVIVISEDTLIFGTNINQLYIGIRFCIYIALLFFSFNHTWRHIDKKLFWLTMGVIASFFCTMILNNDLRNGYILQLLVIITALKISNKIEFNIFLEYFEKIIYFLSIASLILYFFVYLLPSSVKYLPIINNYSDVEFATIFVSNIMQHEGTLRNSGIFREPGVFGLYLIISLIYELFYLKKANLKKVLIFLITLITTFSTMAFFAFAFLFIGYLFQLNKSKTHFYLFILIGGIALCLLPFISDSVFSKLNAENAAYRSTLSRIASVSIPLAIFGDHLMGVGLSNFVDLYSRYSLLLFDIEFKPDGEATNTFINTFAIYGGFYGILLLYAVWKLARRSCNSKSKFIIIILFLVYILIFSSQELRFSLLFNLLVMYGLVNAEVVYKKIK